MWLLVPSALAGICFDEPTYSVEGEHVVVGFEDVGVGFDEAEATLERVEAAWQEQIVERGWRAPPGTDSWSLLVEVEDRGGAAWTDLRDCPDGSEMAVLVLPAEHTYPNALVAHELNHAIQQAYDEQPVWIDEATATWMQWQTVPQDVTWVRDLARRGLFTQAHIPLEASDRSDADVEAHMYAMALFLEHAERSGHSVRSIWEGDDPDLVALWVSWLPELMTDAYELGVPQADGATTNLPFETAGSALPEPHPLGFSVFFLDREATDPDHGDVRVTLDTNPSGEFVGWLVAERGDGWETTAFPFDNGEAALVLDDLSTTVDGAWVVLGPTAGEPDETFLWLLSASAQGDPPSVIDSQHGTSSAFREGCSVGAVGPWWLALVLLWRRR
ncbi:MAG: hypothetical protein GY913_34675 [Proteobacteria bacterium]|nr:hypothetical protein [Pseudomonadota bacterium]MCP4922076.1 hypothetical protein [Pseudomonadota bacterium]